MKKGREEQLAHYPLVETNWKVLSLEHLDICIELGTFARFLSRVFDHQYLRLLDIDRNMVEKSFLCQESGPLLILETGLRTDSSVGFPSYSG